MKAAKVKVTYISPTQDKKRVDHFEVKVETTLTFMYEDATDKLSVTERAKEHMKLLMNGDVIVSELREGMASGRGTWWLEDLSPKTATAPVKPINPEEGA